MNFVGQARRAFQILLPDGTTFLGGTVADLTGEPHPSP